MKIREPIIISLIQHFEADFLWKVSLKILNLGIILKTSNHEYIDIVKIQISWLHQLPDFLLAYISMGLRK